MSDPPLNILSLPPSSYPAGDEGRGRRVEAAPARLRVRANHQHARSVLAADRARHAQALQQRRASLTTLTQPFF